MTSTYVNDLRLEEMATGDQSGTWGTTTNTNLELIGEALGYGTQQVFGSDANATTTVADGTADPARAMYFKVTSGTSLSATRTMTIAPATMSRVMFIENATSGSQSISVSQGSGANVTIPNGAVKMVYLDGAGAGAAVTDALIDLNLGGTLTVGVDDTGHDVKFFGATSGQYMLWDESHDELVLAGDSKLSFNDAAGGENIVASADGHLEINSGTTLDITAATTQVNASTLFDVNGAMDVSGAITGTTATFTTNDNTAQLTLKSTDTDASGGPILDLSRDNSSAAANDVLGLIRFIGDDAGNNQTTYAQMIGFIGTPTAGAEGGIFKIEVASHDAGMEAGLVIKDGDADGELDVDIAAGTSSVTTVAGLTKATAGVQYMTNDITASAGTIYHDSSNRLRFAGGTAGYLFLDDTNGTGQVSIDSLGNVGIGATPATWNSGNTALQIGGNGTLHGSTAAGASKFLALTQNAHIDSDASWEYISEDEASNYYQDGGAHHFRSVVSGAAGNNITWVQSMKINVTGSSRVLEVGNNSSSSDQVVATFFSSNGSLGATTQREIELLSYWDGSSDKRGAKMYARNTGYPNNQGGDLTFTTRNTSNGWTDALRIDNSAQVTVIGGHFLAHKASANGATTGFEARTTGQVMATIASATNEAVMYITQTGGGGNNDDDQGLVVKIQGTNATSGAGNVLRCAANNGTHGTYDDILTVKNDATVFMNQTLTFGGVLNLHHGGIGMGEGSSSGEYRRMYWNTSNDDLRFWNGSNEGSINSSGAWTDASDVSLKKDISDITYGINTIKALKPRKYKMKADNKDQVGFIAQEMETQIPEIVTSGTNPNGEEHKGIAYGQLTAVLTKALQEAIEKIETLETKVAALEGS